MNNRGGQRGRARSSSRGGGRRGDVAGTSSHDAGTSDNGPSRIHKWTPKTTRIMLELVIEELEAEDYTVRLPLGPDKRRLEEKLYELTEARVKWSPEIKVKLDYLRRLWYYNKTLSGRTSVYVNQTTGKIEMLPLPSWWED